MSTIKQKSVAVDLVGQSVEVRRMRWKDARDFLKRFSSIATTLYKDKPDGMPFGALLMARLPDVVSGSDELILHLIKGSTDLTADQIDGLDVISIMQILGAAMEANFDDELKKCWAALGAKIAALMPANQTTT